MIELVNVEKTYYSKAGDIHALHKTSLSIKAGEIFGIIGLSGAGKSTLVRCINMLEKPTAGQVFVDGQELTAMSEMPETLYLRPFYKASGTWGNAIELKLSDAKTE